jgi:hypothetical protein
MFIHLKKDVYVKKVLTVSEKCSWVPEKKQKIKNKEKTNTRKGQIFKTKILSQLIKWKEKEQISKHKKYDIELYVLPPFQNIRCLRFVKQMYLDNF